MADTLKIASRSPMPFRMEIMDGEGKVTDFILINAAGADAGFPEGVTEGVDAELYQKWVDANPNHDFLTGGLMRVIGDDEPVTEYGFEAGLAAAADDADNVKLAEEGSTITDPGPVSAEDMAATSDTPNTDLPNSQVNTGGENTAQEPVEGDEAATGVSTAPAAVQPADDPLLAPADPVASEPSSDAK